MRLEFSARAGYAKRSVRDLSHGGGGWQAKKSAYDVSRPRHGGAILLRESGRY